MSTFTHKNVTSITASDLCTGCGICENICPNNAIKIGVKKGVHVPVVEQQKCKSSTGCNLCVKVCAGYEIDIYEKSKKLFGPEGVLTDYYVGDYHSCYVGHSNDESLRFHSASGGVTTAFIIYLLEKKIISGAIVTKFDDNDPLKPFTFMAKTKEDVLASKSSKYCPVSFDGILHDIKELDGKCVVVGLPCHVHSLRKLEEVYPKLGKKIFGYFTLYCSAEKTFYSQDYIFEKYGIKKEKLKTFAYRDDGCMGFLKATYHDGEVIKRPFKEYYLSMRGFFNPERCTMCIDHYGELGDVSFGDLHTGKYAKDTIGVTSWVVRNKKFLQLFNNAEQDGYITWEELDVNTLKDSQVYAKRQKKGPGVKATLEIRQRFNKLVPLYDSKNNSTVSVKFYVRHFLNIAFRVIGRNKILWPLITFMDKAGQLIRKR